MTATIFLVRHAAHADLGCVLTGRGGDVPLSEIGRIQAARLGDRLAGESVSAVQTSPQRRAEETALIAAARMGISEIRVVSGLDEIDFGEWTGREFGELERDPEWARWNMRRSEAAPPGGESMARAATRAVAYVEGLATGADRRVVCVTHGDIIRGVIAHYLGLSLDNLLRFDIDAASISRLLIGQWGGRVAALNEGCGA